MSNTKSKIIVYGLGRAYENSRIFLKDKFDILAYSDKKWDKYLWGGGNFSRKNKCLCL